MCESVVFSQRRLTLRVDKYEMDNFIERFAFLYHKKSQTSTVIESKVKLLVLRHQPLFVKALAD